MTWQVVCDFDGTIADIDVTDSLLTRFAEPEWQAIEASWTAGEIGSRECMSRQVALLKMSVEGLDHHLAGIRIDPDFPGFVAFCDANGIRLIVASDGLDYAVQQVLSRHGLGHLPIYANHLEPLADQRWQLTSIHAAPGCASGTCKCMIADAIAREPAIRPRTLLIGDGTSDFCLAGIADLTFAKKSLLRHTRERALPHLAFDSFLDAKSMLAHLTGIADQPSGIARTA